MSIIAVKIDSKIPAIFNRIKPGATFMAVNGYTNNSNEISNFNIIFHFSYENAVRKSLNIWKNVNDNELSLTHRLAKSQLISSYNSSLTGFNPGAKSAGSYIAVKDGNNKLIDGVKLNIKNKELHLFGLVFNKKIVKPGVYKTVNRSELTLAKQDLLKMTPLSKFRQFKLIDGRFESIAVQNIKLTDEDLCHL